MSEQSAGFKYEPISVSDVLKMDIKPLEWVIDDLLVDGSAVLMSGREKSGKGLTCVDKAVCVATEQPFAGKAIRKPGPVLYLALEENLRTLRARFGVRCAGLAGVQVDILPLDGSHGEATFNLQNVAHLQALTDLIRERQYVLIIIDTLREAHTGRENDSDEMAPIIRPIRVLAHSLGVTIVVTHHQDKVNGNSRGSTSIRAGFDDELHFSRIDSGGDSKLQAVLKAEGRNLPKYVVHATFDAETARWIPTDAPEIAPDPSVRDRILSTLENCGEWMTAKDLAAVVPNSTLKTIQNTLSDMLKEDPMPFASTENPTKTNPRKYHSLSQRMDLDPPANVHKLRQCVHCGAPVSKPGSLYCAKHGGTAEAEPDAEGWESAS